MSCGLPPVGATNPLQMGRGLRVLPLPNHRRSGCRDGVGCTDAGMDGVAGRSHSVPEPERILSGPEELSGLAR